MKALIAFIVMAAGILTLIEINERLKAKKKASSPAAKEVQKDETCNEACAECGLIEACEKEGKQTVSKGTKRRTPQQSA